MAEEKELQKPLNTWRYLNSLFTEKNIVLPAEQLSWLEQCETEAWFPHSCFYYALQSIAKAAAQADKKESLIQFIALLKNMSTRFYDNHFNQNKQECLLVTFLVFLRPIKEQDLTSDQVTPAQVMLSDTTLTCMQKWLEADNEALAWLYLLTEVKSNKKETRRIRTDFHLEENDRINYDYLALADYDFCPQIKPITYALSAFLDYFKQQQLALPTSLEQIDVHRASGIKRLSDIIECISVAPHPQLLTLRMAWIPKEIYHAVSCLRSGYCMVHFAMQLHRPTVNMYELKLGLFIKDFQLRDIKMPFHDCDALDNYLTQIRYQFCHAVYLRFLAYHTDVHTFIAGVEHWENTMGSLEQWLKFTTREEQMNKHWETLKEYALNLPTRLQAPTSINEKPSNHAAFVNEFAIEEAMTTFSYTFTEELALHLQLSHSEELKFLKSGIAQLNDYAPHYRLMQNLNDEISSAKTTVSLNPIQCLALLREMHYRLSDQTEWLRLEQACAILLALRPDGRLMQSETSEGKTLILQLIAVIKALQGQKVDVLTHNQSLAKTASEEIRKLASALNLTVANTDSSIEDKVAADILYQDIATSVIHYLIAGHENAPMLEQPIAANEKGKEKEQEPCLKPLLPGQRPRQVLLVDEGDNVLIDMYLTDMRYSLVKTDKQNQDKKNRADENFKTFLLALNQAMSALIATIPSHPDQTANKESHREFMREKLKDLAHYKKLHLSDNDNLDMWIRAARMRMELKINQDYIIDTEGNIRIVHKKTTGRIDETSQWSDGVHQCVAAWELVNNSLVKIPPMSKVVAQSRIPEYLRLYDYRLVITGTLGDQRVQKQMAALMNVPYPSTVCLPRAARPLEPGVAWPRKVISKHGAAEENQDVVVTEFHRGYHFHPIILPNRKEHEETLRKALIQARDQHYSALIFVNTIEECRVWLEKILAFGMDRQHVQLLDDTNPKNGEKENPAEFKFMEHTVIKRASNEKMVTITTSAGARGIDFEKVTFAFIIKPDLLPRVNEQKKGRVARNGKLGVTYEIYCAEDFTAYPELIDFFAWKENEKVKKPVEDIDSSGKITPWHLEQQKVCRDLQYRDLDRIEKQEPYSQFIAWLQKKCWDKRKKLKEPINKNLMYWPTLFGHTLKSQWQMLENQGIPGEEAIAQMKVFAKEKIFNNSNRSI